MGHYNTFIVRVWTDGDVGWTRGYIEHVNSRERTYFTEKSKMDEFIMSHLGPPSSPPDGSRDKAEVGDMPEALRGEEGAGE